MKAQIGDRLIPGENADHVGMIIGLREPDGSPPYVVKWLDSGHIALIFPGPYARVLRSDPDADRHTAGGRASMADGQTPTASDPRA